MSHSRAFYFSAAQTGMVTYCLLSFACGGRVQAETPSFDLKIEQVTSGTKHHFFGYIGQCQTIPWNADNRYILGMEIDHIGRMPSPEEAALIILVDTQQNNKIIRMDKTHAWNPQQGTMFYWNPRAPATQFFFNDRDVHSGKVFTVLYDIDKRARVREYRYEDTPIGNGGVASNGDMFLGLNYGRLARLRLVTGYPGALDWSKKTNAPDHDGIFVVDIMTGKKRVLVSYRQLADQLKQRQLEIEDTALFINHTLWNRRNDRVYFFVRGGWKQPGTRINMPCSIHVDGSGLTLHDVHIGGHPEWAEDNLLIGRERDEQILYDVDKMQVVGHLGTPEIFPNPEGDIALSANGEWFVNGYKKDDKNYYVVYRRSDGVYRRSEGLDKGSGGILEFDGTGLWTPNANTFTNVTISTGTVTTTANVTVSSNLTVSGGNLQLLTNSNSVSITGASATVDLTGGTWTQNAAQGLTFNGSGIHSFNGGGNTIGFLSVGTAANVTVNITGAVTAAATTVNDAGDILNVNAGPTVLGNGNAATVLNGDITMTADTTFEGALTLTGGTFTCNTNGVTLRFGAGAITDFSVVFYC